MFAMVVIALLGSKTTEDSTLQSAKADAPIVVIFAGIVIFANLIHPAKADSPIVVRFSYK
ncbi:hypothetical protein KML24004_22380 [Alistipes indistinctus]